MTKTDHDQPTRRPSARVQLDMVCRAVDTRTSHSAKPILVALVRHADPDTGRAEVTIAQIAETANVRERTVQRALRELGEDGIVILPSHDERLGHGGQPRMYQIRFSRLARRRSDDER